VGGWSSGGPGSGAYCATKFAMEGVVEVLQQETAASGVKNILFEPGYYRTKVFGGENMKWAAAGKPELDQFQDAIKTEVMAIDGAQPGDPAKAAERMVDVVRGEGVAAGREIPLRMPIGADAMETIRKKCLETLRVIDEWEGVLGSTDFDVQ
jgi:NAD(P)-dependent dehydrogenase (short-subunit alcohol dehydrogenase family)